MRIHKPIQTLFGTLALAGLVACAGSGSGGGAGEAAEPSGNGIMVEVNNDIAPPTSVVMWVVAETGARFRLGPVPPNSRRSFTYEPATQSQQIYLLAVPEGPASGTMGRTQEQQSNTFPVVGVKSVSWSVTQRNVRIGG